MQQHGEGADNRDESDLTAIGEHLDAVAKKLGFGSVNPLSDLLELSEDGASVFCSIPFVDTIYYPCSPSAAKDRNFSSLAPTLEEDIHLYQFRRSPAGWYMELLNRRFGLLARKASQDKHRRTLPHLQKLWALLKGYHDSIRIPLELEAHCVLMTYLMPEVGIGSETVHRGYLETFSFGERPPDVQEARDALEQKYISRWVEALQESLQPVEGELGFTSAWLSKIAEISAAVVRRFRQGCLSVDDYTEELGNCLEFRTVPAVAALMVKEPPRRSFRGTVSDPLTRLELAAESVLDLSEDAIRGGDMAEVTSRIEKVMPLMDDHSILRKRRLAARQVRSERPTQPLLTLRLAFESLPDNLQSEWSPPSSLCDAVQDKYGASVLIFLKDGVPEPTLVNDDFLGRRFLNELGQLCEGYALVRE